MAGIPPLEPVKKPLVLRWWFLMTVFLAVIIAGSFGMLVYENYRALQKGEISIAGGITRDPNATATNVAIANVVTDDDPSLGPKDAKVVVVEFADFQCPYCQEAFPIIRELTVKYADKVRFIYRDFPVGSVHPDAQNAAIAASCVAKQDQVKFWLYHDKLYLNQEDLGQDALLRYALQVGADEQKFLACINDSSVAQEVQNDYQDGIIAGVTGTPTFFIDGRRVPGVIPLDIFTKALDSELSKQQ